MTYKSDVYVVNLGAEAVAASTGYVLVDLSDTTNYPHSKTNQLHLLGLMLSIEAASSGQYDIWVGGIFEVDATNGSTTWCDVFHTQSDDNATDNTSKFQVYRDYTLSGTNPQGVNFQVNSAGTGFVAFVGNQGQSGNATWQTDTGLASPVGAAGGATGRPGAGDIVVWVEETGGTGTVDFSVTAVYEAL